MRPKLLVAIAVCCALLVGTVAVLAQGPQPQGVTAALGSGFTYQGQLNKYGVPVNGTCHFTFSLWDAQSGGTQLGSNQAVPNVNVVNGLFTLQLNGAGQFSVNAFNGDARWLQARVQCGSDPSATTSTRQALSAT